MSTLASPLPSTSADLDVPRLLDGTELLGQAAGSGLRQAPFLVRRCDGQIIQLSPMLYEFARRMDGRELEDIAQEAGDALELRVSGEQVAFIAESKFAPLGLVAYRDGHTAPLQSRNALLSLRYRVGLVPGRVVDRLAAPLQILFFGPLVAVALAALLALDVWLGVSHRLSTTLGAVVQSPGLLLTLLGVTVLSLAIHEFGHAAACRYGGARPGRIGVGLYLVWPVFFSDVTDTYRLPRGGRLRTDLGGVYFNALIAVGTGVAAVATHDLLLLVIAVSQQLLILDQFMPWMRLDGYHVISDLIGVPDLFARIGPILASLRPGARPARRVSELKTWARAAVTIWVLTTVTMLLGMLLLIATHASAFLRENWAALVLQVRAVEAGVRGGELLVAANATANTLLLLFPVAGVLLTYFMLCRGLGASLAVRRSRRELTLAPAREGLSAS